MIPDGWTREKLGNVTTYKKGFAFSSKDYQKSGVRIIRISDTNRDSIHDNNPVFINDELALEHSDHSLNEGDILLSTVGSRPHLPDSMVGKAVRISKDAHGSLLNQNLVKLSAKSETTSEEILYIWLKDSRFISFLSSLVRGNANQVSITLKDIFNYPIIAPPVDEQKKIAEILGTWDRAIEVAKKQLENAKTQKRALMQQLLTGKRRFTEFEEHEWKEVQLGDAGTISSAGVDKKSNPNEIPVRLLNFLDVFRREFLFDYQLEHEVTAPTTKIGKCNVLRGDIFFTPSSETRNEIAVSAVAAEDMPQVCYSYHVVRFRLNQYWDINFRAYVFQADHFRRQAYKLGDGSGQRYVISQGNFRNMTVLIPSLAEQEKIGSVLKYASDEIAVLNSKIDKLMNEKKALMQQLLTGKKRVKV